VFMASGATAGKPARYTFFCSIAALHYQPPSAGYLLGRRGRGMLLEDSTTVFHKEP
jgi:hypothetical protein